MYPCCGWLRGNCCSCGWLKRSSKPKSSSSSDEFDCAVWYSAVWESAVSLML